jgi:hypothetical protein
MSRSDRAALHRRSWPHRHRVLAHPALTAQPTNRQLRSRSYAADCLSPRCCSCSSRPCCCRPLAVLSMGRPIFPARAAPDGNGFQILVADAPAVRRRVAPAARAWHCTRRRRGADRRTRVGASAADVARRAPAALERPARRDEPRRPRPERPEYVAPSATDDRHGERHRVKAGITGEYWPSAARLAGRPRRVGQRHI